MDLFATEQGMLDDVCDLITRQAQQFSATDSFGRHIRSLLNSAISNIKTGRNYIRNAQKLEATRDQVVVIWDKDTQSARKATVVELSKMIRDSKEMEELFS